VPMEKLKQIIAYVVKKRGKNLKEEDLVNVLSYDRKWIPPASSRALFKVMLDANLLKKNGDHYEPNFEIKGLVLPLDFSVSEEDVAKYFKKEDVLTRIIDYLTEKTGRERREILMDINSIKNEMKYITIEVAALIYCKENEIDCSQFYNDVREKIKS